MSGTNGFKSERNVDSAMPERSKRLLPREEPVRALADSVESRVNGAYSARSIREAGLQRGESSNCCDVD